MEREFLHFEFNRKEGQNKIVLPRKRNPRNRKVLNFNNNCIFQVKYVE